MLIGSAEEKERRQQVQFAACADEADEKLKNFYLRALPRYMALFKRS